jgi:hypothetical protein
MSKKPIQLRQIPIKHRVALWVSVGLALLIIMAGWFMTTRNAILRDITDVQNQVNDSIERAGASITDFSDPAISEAGEQADDFKESFQQLKDAIVEEQSRRAGESEEEAQTSTEVKDQHQETELTE